MTEIRNHRVTTIKLIMVVAVFGLFDSDSAIAEKPKPVQVIGPVPETPVTGNVSAAILDTVDVNVTNAVIEVESMVLRRSSRGGGLIQLGPFGSETFELDSDFVLTDLVFSAVDVRGNIPDGCRVALIEERGGVRVELFTFIVQDGHTQSINFTTGIADVIAVGVGNAPNCTGYLIYSGFFL